MRARQSSERPEGCGDQSSGAIIIPHEIPAPAGYSQLSLFERDKALAPSELKYGFLGWKQQSVKDDPWTPLKVNYGYAADGIGYGLAEHPLSRIGYYNNGRDKAVVEEAVVIDECPELDDDGTASVSNSSCPEETVDETTVLLIAIYLHALDNSYNPVHVGDIPGDDAPCDGSNSQENTSRGESAEDTIPTTASPTEPSASSLSTSSEYLGKRRGRGGGNDDEDGSDQRRGGKRGKYDTVPILPRTYACFVGKYAPRDHPDCILSWFRDMAHLREHMRKYHLVRGGVPFAQAAAWETIYSIYRPLFPALPELADAIKTFEIDIATDNWNRYGYLSRRNRNIQRIITRVREHMAGPSEGNQTPPSPLAQTSTTLETEKTAGNQVLSDNLDWLLSSHSGSNTYSAFTIGTEDLVCIKKLLTTPHSANALPDVIKTMQGFLSRLQPAHTATDDAGSSILATDTTSVGREPLQPKLVVLISRCADMEGTWTAAEMFLPRQDELVPQETGYLPSSWPRFDNWLRERFEYLDFNWSSWRLGGVINGKVYRLHSADEVRRTLIEYSPEIQKVKLTLERHTGAVVNADAEGENFLTEMESYLHVGLL